MLEILGVALFAAAGGLLYRVLFEKTIVYEYQRGLLYRNGKFVKVLPPGAYRHRRTSTHIAPVDVRSGNVTVSGQEVLTEDNVGLKVSLSITYRITDPEKAMHSQQSFMQSLYTSAQIALRDAVGAVKVDDLLATRGALGRTLMDKVVPQAELYGVALEALEIKDVMFPGELKKIFAEVVRAKKEGQANLERARGESAALRNLANAARLLENNPALMNLRVLQALSGTNSTVVLGNAPGLVPMPASPAQGKAPAADAGVDAG